MSDLSLDDRARRQFIVDAARYCLGVSILPLGAGLVRGAQAPKPAQPGKPAQPAKPAAKPAAAAPAKARQVIYLMMSGAMSQIDTFDPKPNSKHQGETKTVQTKLPGVNFGEHFKGLAALADKLAVVRSMNTTTADHSQARYLLETNYKQIATTKHPGLGSWTQKLLGRMHQKLPPTVHVGEGAGPGYLGAQFSPVPIGDPSKGLQNTLSPKYLTNSQFDQRMKLSSQFDAGFRGKAKNTDVNGYDDLYREAISLLRSEDLKAFDINAEPEAQKQAYGTTRFGQGCLLARRLIENKVRFVQVSFGSWDHHNEIFDNLPPMATELDRVATTLMKDLDSKGLLETTLVVIGTEFGRRPPISNNQGRDHHPAAFSCMLAGGGVRGGQVYGKTDEDAYRVEDDAVSVADFNATIASALGMPHDKVITSPDGRPFTLGNEGKPLTKLL